MDVNKLCPMVKENRCFFREKKGLQIDKSPGSWYSCVRIDHMFASIRKCGLFCFAILRHHFKVKAEIPVTHVYTVSASMHFHKKSKP